MIGIITDILLEMVVIAIPTTCDDFAIITNVIINKIPMINENGSQLMLLIEKILLKSESNKPTIEAVM